MLGNVGIRLGGGWIIRGCLTWLDPVFWLYKKYRILIQKGLTRITESPEVRLAAYTKTAELYIAPYGRLEGRPKVLLLNLIIGIGSQLLFAIPSITPLIKIL